MQQGSRWFVGPSFLREPEDCWPKEKKGEIEFKPHDKELRPKEREIYTIREFNLISGFLPNFSRFSTWPRLVRVTSRVLEAADILLKIEESRSELDRRLHSEELWFKEIQLFCFEREIKLLGKALPLSKDSRIISLNPFMDERGLLRVRGRVKFLPGTCEKLQPLILDANHPVAQLLILHYHEKFYHKNHETVVNELRQEFRILGLRRCLRSIVNKCSMCRLLRGNPYLPIMGYLPRERLGYRLRPFTHCGIDYFGPIAVKVGRRREKRWGALFTCLTTREIG